MKTSIERIRDAFLFTFFLFVCLSQTMAQKKSPKQDVDLYVGGFIEGPNRRNIAVYLKNGVPVRLTDGQHHAEVTAMYIDGNDVYAAGYHRDHLVYWKNGQEISITDPPLQGWINQILIKNNEVHIVGTTQFINHNGPNRLKDMPYEILVATYWKNGQAMALTDPSLPANGAGIAIDPENNVYIAGYEALKTRYWKNGQPVAAFDKAAYTVYPTGVVIANNNIYVSGYSIEGPDNEFVLSKRKPIYWSGREGATILPELGENGGATAIAVSGKDVYVAGFNSQYLPTYWKNGVAAVLDNAVDTDIPERYSIAVHEDNVYIAGLSSTGAQCWKNGIPLLKKGDLRKALCLAVVPKKSTNSSKVVTGQKKEKAQLQDKDANLDSNEKINSNPPENKKSLTEEFIMKPGLQKTKSGLMFQVVKEGSGSNPLLSDNIKILFKLSYIENNIEHMRPTDGQPQIINVGQHPNLFLREAMLYMKTGGRYKFLVLPHQFNTKGSPGIEAMIYDVELLEIIR
ncbi:MAG: hypothetical protein K0R59_2756 [Sphingobacterium sp.]|jgi:FKBP-type peptidyl-prolyl cis-trans isomerase|nr:hypothetical protein [Sphingobacterium sp.]